jgi:hypothetical protein
MDQQSVSIVFDVEQVAAVEDKELNVYSLNFGGALADNSEWFLSVQLSLEASEQDISLGHDTYAVTTSTGATHYNGIIGWGYWSYGVYMDFDDEAAGVLGLQNRINFHLPDKAEILSTVEAGLTRLLGAPCLSGRE